MSKRTASSPINSGPPDGLGGKLDGWIRRILAVPRVWRLAFVGVCSLTLVAVIFPLVDSIYLRNFFAPETVVVPSLVSAFAMLLMYGIGYWLMVGWRGETPAPRRWVLLYVLFGLLMIGIGVGLIVFGLSLTAGSPETF